MALCDGISLLLVVVVVVFIQSCGHRANSTTHGKETNEKQYTMQ